MTALSSSNLLETETKKPNNQTNKNHLSKKKSVSE